MRYSRKLAALGRLSAGVAHEVKNPLNAMMIHLELLRQQFGDRARRAAGPSRVRAACPSADASRRPGDGDALAVAEPPPSIAPRRSQHVDVIANEIRRLDEVVQGFLKFTRPEDLKLQPVGLGRAARRGRADRPARGRARRRGARRRMRRRARRQRRSGDAAAGVPQPRAERLSGDADGGTLRIRCEAARGRRVAISFSDTGVGIKPEHLQRIFDLYFTTKEKGSGIGLSMVYRTVQMHDGEIEVQSTPGAGTTFRVLLPQS